MCPVIRKKQKTLFSGKLDNTLKTDAVFAQRKKKQNKQRNYDWEHLKRDALWISARKMSAFAQQQDVATPQSIILASKLERPHVFRQFFSVCCVKCYYLV